MNSLTVGLVASSELLSTTISPEAILLFRASYSSGEGLEVPAVVSSGQTDVVAVLQTEVAVGGSDVAPLACLDVAQSGS